MDVPADFGVESSQLTRLIVPTDLQQAKEPEERILNAVRQYHYDADAVFAIKLSLEEAITNAIRHGNRGDRTKQITVKYYIDADRVVIMVRDEGCGFQPHAVPDPTADENLERPCGRGLMLMQSYMTRVEFNPAGNEVWMLKRRHPQSNEGV